MNNKLRLGCIGTGNILQHAHMPQHAVIHEYEVVGLYDVDHAHAEKAKEIYVAEKERLGIPVTPESIVIYNDVEHLLANVDMVDICTSLKYHAYYADLALKHNVSAMSEKPMARTWLEAHEVAKSEASSKGFYQLNDDNLFIPRFLTMKALIDGGWIGDILSVRIARGTPSSRRAQWFYDVIEGGGGCIMDYGSHAVTNAWFLVGLDKRPVEVRSMGIECREPVRVVEGRMQRINIDDDAHFKVLFRNDKTGDWIDVAIESTWTWQHFGTRSSDVEGYVEVEGTLGRMSTEKDDETGALSIQVESRTMGKRMIPVTNVGSEEYSFNCEFINLARSILKNKRPYYNAEIAQDTIAILNAAQLSEQCCRKTVSLEELKEYSLKALESEQDPWKAADMLCKAFNRKFLETK